MSKAAMIGAARHALKEIEGGDKEKAKRALNAAIDAAQIDRGLELVEAGKVHVFVCHYGADVDFEIHALESGATHITVFLKNQRLATIQVAGPKPEESVKEPPPAMRTNIEKAAQAMYEAGSQIIRHAEPAFGDIPGGYVMISFDDFEVMKTTILKARGEAP